MADQKPWATVVELLDQGDYDRQRFRAWHSQFTTDAVELAEIIEEEMALKGPATVNWIYRCEVDPGHGGRLIVGHFYILVEVYADGCADRAYNFLDISTGQSLLNDPVDRFTLLEEWLHLFSPVRAYRIQVHHGDSVPSNEC